MIFYCVIRKKIYHQRICYIKFIIVFYANMILVLICTFFFISFIFLWCYMYTCISFKYVLAIYNIYLMTRIWFNFQSFFFLELKIGYICMLCLSTNIACNSIICFNIVIKYMGMK